MPATAAIPAGPRGRRAESQDRMDQDPDWREMLDRWSMVRARAHPTRRPRPSSSPTRFASPRGNQRRRGRVGPRGLPVRITDAQPASRILARLPVTIRQGIPANLLPCGPSDRGNPRPSLGPGPDSQDRMDQDPGCREMVDEWLIRSRARGARVAGERLPAGWSRRGSCARPNSGARIRSPAGNPSLGSSHQSPCWVVHATVGIRAGPGMSARNPTVQGTGWREGVDEVRGGARPGQEEARPGRWRGVARAAGPGGARPDGMRAPWTGAAGVAATIGFGGGVAPV